MKTENGSDALAGFTAEQADALAPIVAAAREAESLRREVDDLRRRLSELEGRLAALAPDEGLSSETLAILGAVIAAHLGKRVRVRRARPLPGPNPWVHAGRVSVQGVHDVRRSGASR